jgi:hypothetical protein
MKYVLLATMLLVAPPSGWCARNRETQKNDSVVHLRDEVEVKQNRVWLSDLLPPEAPAAIQNALASIELCRAPQPGSVRVLDAAQIAARLAGQFELLGQLAIPSRITIRYTGWPIAEEKVRLAISEFLRQQSWHDHGGRRDLPDAARLEWTLPLSATIESPKLEVVGLDWDDRQQSAQVRLRCSPHASCGGFMVHVVLSPPLAREWREQLTLGSALSSSGEQPAAANGNSSVLAEKGKPATLVLDDGSMRISVRVICLQRGVLNQEIRVVEAQGRHVFHAEVVGMGLLHANL